MVHITRSINDIQIFVNSESLRRLHELGLELSNWIIEIDESVPEGRGYKVNGKYLKN